MGCDPGSTTYRKFQRQPRCLLGGGAGGAGTRAGKLSFGEDSRFDLSGTRFICPEARDTQFPSPMAPKVTSAKYRFASLRKIVVVSWENVVQTTFESFSLSGRLDLPNEGRAVQREM